MGWGEKKSRKTQVQHPSSIFVLFLKKLGMVICTCNPRTREEQADAWDSLDGQPVLLEEL